MTATALPGALSAAAASVQLDFASEPQDESMRAAGGTLGIPELTRCHAVVWDSRLIHERTTSADAVVV